MVAALIIAAILEIIILVCFFYLCYNVSRIKKHLVQTNDFETKFKFLMKIGEKERAHEILITRILANNDIFSEDVADADYKAKLCFKVYAEELAALGIENPFPKEEKKD